MGICVFGNVLESLRWIEFCFGKLKLIFIKMSVVNREIVFKLLYRNSFVENK